MSMLPLGGMTDFSAYVQSNFPAWVPYTISALKLIAEGAKGLSVEDARNKGLGVIVVDALIATGTQLSAELPTSAPMVIADILQDYNTSRGGTTENPAPIRAISIPGFTVAQDTAWQNAIIGGYLTKTLTATELQGRANESARVAQRLAADEALQEESMRIWDAPIIKQLADIGEGKPLFPTLSDLLSGSSEYLKWGLIIAAGYVGYRLLTVMRRR